MAVPKASQTNAAVTVGQSGLSFSYAKTFGVTGVGWLADTAHINYPYGISTDGSNLWVGEMFGNRALKYNSAGTFQMQIGTAGFPDSYDNTSLYEITDTATDGAGNIWVVDDSSSHVVKFNSSGVIQSELGVVWNSGTDNGHFAYPQSIAFDAGGNIYVSDGTPWWCVDCGNHRIQVFDNTGSYLTTIGETGVIGSDNNHFHGPRHIAVHGNKLFVADAGNHRIQIFNITNPSAPVYSATIGVSGVSGGDTSHLDTPSGVAVDNNFIYVADTNNNRVQFFNPTTYAYQATLGFGWGTDNNHFDNPTDVALDSAGDLYVADFNE